MILVDPETSHEIIGTCGRRRPPGGTPSFRSIPPSAYIWNQTDDTMYSFFSSLNTTLFPPFSHSLPSVLVPFLHFPCRRNPKNKKKNEEMHQKQRCPFVAYVREPYSFALIRDSDDQRSGGDGRFSALNSPWLRFASLVSSIHSLSFLIKKPFPGSIVSVSRHSWWSALSRRDPFRFRLHLLNSLVSTYLRYLYSRHKTETKLSSSWRPNWSSTSLGEWLCHKVQKDVENQN